MLLPPPLLRQQARWLRILPHRATRAYSAPPAAAPWGPPAPGTEVYAMLSGGVDSSVAAVLLQEAGYVLRPVFMRNWDTLDEDLPGSGGCEWERDWDDVQRLCVKSLGGVKPELVDLRREYWGEVFEPALGGWGRGVTPNPDVGCNKEIKFGVLPSKLLARSPSAWLATGHYARLLPSPLNPSRPALHRASFLPKDQSYYLSTSSLDVLSRTLFPLGGMRKDDVRRLAREHNLPTSERKESMGICFVGTRKRFGNFLGSYLNPAPGEIRLPGGKVVGRHEGLWRLTVGEGARISGLPEKHYVARKDTLNNAVTIAPAGHAMLQTTALATNDFKWADGAHPPPEVDSEAGLRVQAQTRSLQDGSIAECAVRRGPGGALAIELLAPLVGVAAGQNVVLYDGAWCLGGGTIDSTRTLWDEQHPSSIDCADPAAASAAPGFPEFAPRRPKQTTVLSDGRTGFPIPVRTRMYAVPSIHENADFVPPVRTGMYEVPSFYRK